jgi:hypothetical protein
MNSFATTVERNKSNAVTSRVDRDKPDIDRSSKEITTRQGPCLLAERSKPSPPIESLKVMCWTDYDERVFPRKAARVGHEMVTSYGQTPEALTPSLFQPNP